ncbi:hypothetical protein PILCRDRAFT_12012 [Piloderma croceum F 1598]|uniref:Uncharacterized protein n=1 Tax=Piloderma croceum (strain F 1598) TaxID=765440 RepID=A0A0C3FC81_PILCF|nr:hypothetical protein PILCRDRAFT_12012 [Piloderma croceum F 1598]
MARTKATARKTTGGTAPRKDSKRSGSSLAMNISSDESMAVVPAPNVPKLIQQDFCYICINGGDMLSCDQCTRVMCKAHIPLPQSQGINVASSIFICVACHLRIFASSKPAPFFGFYKGDINQSPSTWTPMSKQPLVIQGDYQLTASSQVVAQPLLLLHFILASIEPKGHPARISAELLSAYLPADSFVYKEVVFNLTTDELVKKHICKATAFTGNLGKYSLDQVVIIITNHSHDITGDLYLGPNLCSSVEDFMQPLFPPALVSFIQPKLTTVIMMSCGALIGERDSFNAISDFVKRMSIDNLIAFTAKEFHASLVTLFFVDFTYRILIEGFDVNTSMTHMLAAMSQSHLARHTNVVHMRLDTQTPMVDSTIYIFTNPRWRPWGNRLPPACPDWDDIQLLLQAKQLCWLVQLFKARGI